MNIIINNSDLAVALNNARSAINPRMGIAYAGVQLRAKDNMLEVISSDGNSAIRSVVNCMTLENGEVVAPTMLIDLVGKLSGAETQLRVEGSSIKVENKKEKGKAFKSSLALIPGELHFPEKEADCAEVSLKAEDLLSAVNGINFAIAKEDSKAVLTGMNAEIEDSRIILTCLDGFRLSTIAVPAETKIPDHSGKAEAVLAGRFPYLLSRLIKGGDVKLSIGKKSSILECGSTSISCGLMEGSYIDYRKLLSVPENTVTTMKKEELMNAINCAATIDNKDRVIKMEVDDSVVRISAQSDHAKTVSEIDAETKGEKICISVNCGYFSDIIKSVKSDAVTIKMSDPAKPIFVTGNTSNEENHLSLVLPVRTFAESRSA